jgi:uncharacterized damage-inducible protein DinB
MQSESSPSTHSLDIYFRHNLWSNLLLFDACLGLDEAQLEFSTEGTFGSIKSTLGHITFAEERYIFHITSGKQSAESHRPTSTTPLTELRARVAASGETLLQLATSLDGSIRVRVGADDGFSMIPVEALLLQAIHHAHEHRAQIETMLGQLGVDPPGLSAWRYFDEQIGQ